ncbi:MAG: formylglycine-generating enzyme family protein [Mariprofundales bacterium]
MKKLTMIPIILFSIMLLVQPAQAGDYTNSIGMQFKTIPAGSFYMGSCKMSAAQQAENKKRQFMGMSTKSVACPSGAGSDKDAIDSETPQHKVRISKSFQMGVYEVTLGQFKKFIAGAGRTNLLSDDFIKYNSHGDRAAVSYVSWNDARSFISWLNKKEGGKHYRLPSEAEWEYAARAGTTTPHSFQGRVADYAWYTKNAYDVGAEYAHAVGGKRSNKWGLYDTAGNVWEWVQDNWHDSYGDAPADGSIWGGGDDRYRVRRGGSWYRSARYLRSASRVSIKPSDRDFIIGFRLLRQP